MSAAPIIIILLLVSGALNQQRCIWFPRELVQGEFIPLAMAKRSLSALTVMICVGRKIVGHISGLINKPVLFFIDYVES